jgi:hypothetical protein
MLDKNSAVLELFDPEKLNVIPAQLTHLAEGLGLHQDALQWAERANLAGFHAGMHGAIAPYRIATHLVNGRWVEALEECWALYPRRDLEFQKAQLPENVALYLAKTTVTLICFALGTVRVERGKEAASKIVIALESSVNRLGPSAGDAFWPEFLMIASQIGTGSDSSKSLYEAALGWEGKDDHSLGLMYRIAALMHAEPKDAFHLTTHSFSRHLLAWISDTPYAVIVLPFLASYWRWSCQSFASHYPAPARTARVLESALSSGGYIGFIRGLLIISHSLRISLTQREVELLSLVS